MSNKWIPKDGVIITNTPPTTTIIPTTPANGINKIKTKKEKNKEENSNKMLGNRKEIREKFFENSSNSF